MSQTIGHGLKPLESPLAGANTMPDPKPMPAPVLMTQVELLKVLDHAQNTAHDAQQRLLKVQEGLVELLSQHNHTPEVWDVLNRLYNITREQ